MKPWLNQTVEFEMVLPRYGWLGRLDALLYAFTGRGPYIRKVPYVFSVVTTGEVDLIIGRVETTDNYKVSDNVTD